MLTNGPLDASRTMDVIAQAAAGLQAAHAAGLVHRDVKPANILLASGGTVRRTDSGIAHAVGARPSRPAGEWSARRVTSRRSRWQETGHGGQRPVCAGSRRVRVPSRSAAVRRHGAEDSGGPPGSPAATAAPVGTSRCGYLRDAPDRQGSSLVGGQRRRGRARRGAARDGLSAAMGAGTGGGPHPLPEAPARASVTAALRRPRAGRRRPALALAALVLAGLTALVVATMTGFTPGWHQASVAPATPSGPSRATVAPVRTADSPSSSPGGRPPGASPGPMQPRSAAGHSPATPCQS